MRLSYPPFDVCLFYAGGEVFAIEDACNHAGASLCEGSVSDGNISCPMHGYIFSLATGQLVAPKGLCDDQRTFRVTVQGDRVLVDDTFELEIR
jgi:nitrite reductase/ring-hydroxylating ferredoxin subunit